jgi:hypothetical protein
MEHQMFLVVNVIGHTDGEEGTKDYFINMLFLYRCVIGQGSQGDKGVMILKGGIEYIPISGDDKRFITVLGIIGIPG